MILPRPRPQFSACHAFHDQRRAWRIVVTVHGCIAAFILRMLRRPNRRRNYGSSRRRRSDGRPCILYALHAAALAKWARLWEILLLEDDPPSPPEPLGEGEAATPAPGCGGAGGSVDVDPGLHAHEDAPSLAVALRHAHHGRPVGIVCPPDSNGECTCGGKRDALGQLVPHDPKEVGKAPIGGLMPKGIDSATTNSATIDRWFTAKPGRQRERGVVGVPLACRRS